MLPPRPRSDPEGYYARLGLEPAATQTEIVKAFRDRVRVLHPDVPKTGNADKFVAVKQAYDVLSNPERRRAYDRKAQEAAIEPEVIVVHPAAYADATAHPAPLSRQPRFSDLPVVVWFGSGMFLCLCVYEVVTHLLATPKAVREDIRPNAAIVAPLSPSAHRAVLYGPTPVRLAGTPNFYVTPAASPAVLWRMDAARPVLVPLGQLPPFSSVQAVRLVRQSGMLEVLLDDRGNGFISADHLTPGSAAAARRAYCGYNAGPIPFNGELLARGSQGAGMLAFENRAVQPAVVKLRDEGDVVALEVFLEPGGQAEFAGLPEGNYHMEFAIGELWSRACNTFAAGMRAMRIDAAISLPGDSHLVVAPDAGIPQAEDITEQAFERN